MIIPSQSVSINDFANSMRIDYNTKDEIPQIKDESLWKEWGNVVATSPSFVSRGCPTTENFPKWQDWGIIVYGLMVK